MADSELCYGFLLGFLTAGVLGFIFQRIRMLRKKAGAANMKIAEVQTKETPRKVYMSSIRAQTELAFWILLILVIIVAVVWAYLS